RRLVAQFCRAGRSVVSRLAFRFTRRKGLDAEAPGVGIAAKDRRVYCGLRPGRRGRALRFDEWPEHDHRQHWKSLQTRAAVGALERLVMCCFSRPVQSVSATNIFARPADNGRQWLAYSMTLKAKEDLAMVLPLPVQAGSGEKAVT